MDKFKPGDVVAYVKQQGLFWGGSNLEPANGDLGIVVANRRHKDGSKPRYSVQVTMFLGGKPINLDENELEKVDEET